ncbi:MAG: ATPase V [Mediterranea sp.]|jgi:V/A-type H+-transporting ATPase subunit I|nr:ATPase V [Mediterranea sp.]
MITPMRKLTFLVYHKEYEEFLEQIRQLGVVHVAEKQRGEMDESLREHLRKRTLYRNLSQAMFARAGKKPDENGTDASPEDAGEAGDEIADGYERRLADIQGYEQQLATVEKELAQMEVWGDFDWSVLSRLKEAGWQLNFYACSEREYKEEWTERYNALAISEASGHRHFVTITPQRPDLGIEPLRLPSESLSELSARKVATERSLLDAIAEMEVFCKANYRALERASQLLEGEIDLLRVRLNSERMVEGAVLLMEGWIPEDCERPARELLERSGVYYEIRKATREDAAPIKLKNNAFVRMYEVLTKMYGMPDYAEFDPTPLVAPFFTLFFGFCVADAGYGVVLILLGLFMKWKLSKSMAGLLNLVITLGVATTIMGTILGTCFGVNLFDVNMPEWLKPFMVGGKINVGESSYDKQMLLALAIGVVHISIAMTVKALGETVRFGFKNSLSAWGWMLLVVGFVVTGTLSFLEVIPSDASKWVFIVIGGVAAIGIYLLNNLRRNILLNVGAGLWDTYNMVTGLMGDVLSYIRLYALGLAGAMLGGVFNQLGGMVYGDGGVLGWVFCGLILILGHSLNIAMSCLSAFVHPVRLTFVEYFKNSGYDGRGEAYKPFKEVDEVAS